MPWSEVDHNNPCPKCGKADFCSITPDGAVACRRVDDGSGKERANELGVYWLYPSGSESKPRPEENLEVPEVSVAPAERLHHVYSALLDALSLEQPHREALAARSERLTETEFDRRSYRTLPGTGRGKVAASLGEVAGVPGFFLGEHQGRRYWTVAGAAGLLIPMRACGGRIHGLKVRSGGNGPRYTYLSSKGREGGTPAIAAVHVPLHDCGAACHHDVVRVTEGELKADIATLYGTLTISVPGVSCWKMALPVLQALGVRRVLLAFDADARENRFVALALKRAAAAYQEAGLEVELELWEGAKGIDDALVAGVEIRTVQGLEAQQEVEQIHQEASGAVDPIAELTQALEQDAAIAYKPPTLRRLKQLQGQPGEWARAKALLRKHKINLHDIEEAIEDQAHIDEQASQPADDRQRGRAVEIGRDKIVETPTGYLRETWRTDETGQIQRSTESITNWTVELETVVRNAEDNKLLYCGNLISLQRRAKIQLDHTDVNDPREFLNQLRFSIPSVWTVVRHQALSTMIVPALSAAVKEVVGVTATGYMDRHTFVTPSVLIRDGEILPNEEVPCVAGGNLAKHYDFKLGSDEDALAASELLLGDILDLHRQQWMLVLLAAVVSVPLLQPLQWTRAPIYLEGLFESGKTLICKVLCNLYADISTKPGQGGFVWLGSSRGGMELELHFLRDMPVILDDLKMETTDTKAFFQLVQQIYDGSVRSMLKRDSSGRPPRFVRGFPLITGEDIPPGVASSLSRMLVMRIGEGLDLSVLPKIEQERHKLRLLTPRWIAWAQRNRANIKPYESPAFQLPGGKRTDMFSRQYLGGLGAFFRFLTEEFPAWQERKKVLKAYFEIARDGFIGVATHTITRTEAERKEDQFIQTLAALLASGALVLSEPRGAEKRVGFPYFRQQEAGGEIEVLVDIIPEIAINAVCSISKLAVAKETLGRGLQERGYIVQQRGGAGQPTIKRRAGERMLYVWRMRAALLLSEHQMTQIRSEQLSSGRLVSQDAA